MYQHRVPLYLETEDKFVFNLTMRQCLVIGIGLCMAYAAFSDLFAIIPNTVVALIVSFLAAALLLALSVVLALVHIHGRGLDEWLFVLVGFAARPKIHLWHFHQPHLQAQVDRDRQKKRENADLQEVDEW